MIFEKPSLESPFTLEVVASVFVIVLITASITYGLCVLSGIVGGFDKVEKITVFDVINAIAQIATALTFAMAYYQYRKNTIQQRQLIIAAEAKSQLVAITTVIADIQVGEKSCIANLNKSITLIANLAINFDELYNAMSQDIQRAIVRMQWQNMYYNHLMPVLYEIDIVTILKNESGLDHGIIDSVVSFTETQIKSEKIIPAFEKYVLAQKILDHSIVKEKFTLKGKITSLDLFVSHFFNPRNLNDLLYGLMSRVDIRAGAPILALAEPSEWAIK